MILSAGPTLQVPLDALRTRRSAIPQDRRGQTLKDVERTHILEALAETKWVVSGPKGAAVRLGLNRSTLHFHMKKLGIVRSIASSSDARG